MKEPFAKLACSILDSSVWDNDDATVRIWITILAMKDKDGVIHTSLSGLARRARKTIDETRVAVAKFEAPDPDSRNPENEGRRIKRVVGGWLVLNHEWYRNALAPEDQREYERQRKAEQRAKKKPCPGMSGTNGTTGTTGDNAGMSAHHITSNQITSEASDSSKLRSVETASDGAKTHLPPRAGEKDAMERAAALLGPSVMAQWGGLWRKRYRVHPDKFDRVIDCVASELREGKPIGNLGGYANDTWQRFAPKTEI